MQKKIIVFLAGGFEEVEALTPVDYLRRAGVDVTTAAVGGSQTVTGSHGIPVVADTSLAALAAGGKLSPSEWDAVAIPGGLPGADNLAASKEVGAFLKEMAAAGKWVCAICAAPARVLYPLGILAGKKFTCFPGEEKALAGSPGAEWKEDRVVADGNIITSRGAGTAGEFACAVISALAGPDAAAQTAGRVLLRL